MKDYKPKDLLVILITANITCIAFLLLTAWFAYIENGYWGWPFAIACLSAHTLKSSKDRMEEEREERIKRAEAEKKYGKIFSEN